MNFGYLAELASGATTLQRVTSGDTDAFIGRVPDELMSFWHQNGLLFFPASALTLCLPDLYDPHLEHLMSVVPDLHAGDFAAVAYDCFGTTYLWQKTGHLWIYDLQTGLLDNQTARRQLDAVPDDLAQLYADAGVEMPLQGAEEPLLALANAPEDLGNTLANAVVESVINGHLDADGVPLFPQLVERFGPVQEGQVFALIHPDNRHDINSYEKTTISDALTRWPFQLMVSIQRAGGNLPEVETRIYDIPEG
ncbi:GAD-like domain-containing protein [Marivita sp. S0852]|uniref:GAD-like domain-containing protein n=1 Tax=Marivita sp. S0852 TaxID=3373893 RepID=UPI003982A76B